MQAEAAFRQAVVGDFAAAERILAGPVASPEWHLALRAVHWLAAPEIGRAPAVAEVAPHARAPAASRGPLALACEQMELAARLDLDAAAHAEWLALHESLRHGSAPIVLGLRVARAWSASLGGGPMPEDLGELGRDATRAGEADLTVDVQILAALAALGRGDLDGATAAARRASRMARTESVLSREYLANLVLAIVRRRAGLPHRALRILAQLERVVPSPWRTRLSWEQLLAGHRPASRDASHPTPASIGTAMHDAARGGHRAAFDGAAHMLVGRVAGEATAALDAASWIAALDPAREPAAPIEAWARGQTHGAPAGIADPDDAAGCTAFVVASPGRTGRRVLRAGIGLATGAADLSILERDRREAAAIAALALAAPVGLDVADLFARVYGFAFTTEKHDAVLRTLLHRTREALGDSGTVERDGAMLQLRLTRPLIVPDPRCARPPEQRVLALLAAGGGGRTARDLAAELRVPLRTVQLALQGLVDDGEAEANKLGRNVEYRVEDTTFSEPSITRLGQKPRA